jgi:hypothetical protein
MEFGIMEKKFRERVLSGSGEKLNFWLGFGDYEVWV